MKISNCSEENITLEKCKSGTLVSRYCLTYSRYALPEQKAQKRRHSYRSLRVSLFQPSRSRSRRESGDLKGPKLNFPREKKQRFEEGRD